MAKERDSVHRRMDGTSMSDGQPPQDDRMAKTAGSVGGLGEFPELEAGYWREAYSSEPYYEPGRAWGDYAPAYELGWVSYGAYGGEFETADRVMAADWELRKGPSGLSWERARSPTRAGWNRARNRREFVTDGSASQAQVIDTLNELLENACDCERSFREARDHAGSPRLLSLLARRVEHCSRAADELQQCIERLGGQADSGGTVTGAAHRAMLHVRGLFGGASEESVLDECERCEDAALERYREALQQNLPQELHELLLRHYEDAQRNRDEIGMLRAMSRDASPESTEEPS